MLPCPSKPGVPSWPVFVAVLSVEMTGFAGESAHFNARQK
jgi:hypothetical protein